MRTPVSRAVLDRIAQLAASGKTRSDIADEMHYSYAWACILLRRLGLGAIRGERRSRRREADIRADLARQLEAVHRRWVARLTADYEANSPAALAQQGEIHESRQAPRNRI